MTIKNISVAIAALFLIGLAMARWGHNNAATTVDLTPGMILLTFAAAMYFVPALMAWFRSKRDTVAIFALNLLTGWTFVGWVIALVWALKKDPA